MNDSLLLYRWLYAILPIHSLEQTWDEDMKSSDDEFLAKADMKVVLLFVHRSYHALHLLVRLRAHFL